jgi:tetratricopeptide (TPR) repeat protein
MSLLSLTLSLPSAVSAQEWKGRLEFRGRVLDDASAPIKNAIVTMRMAGMAEGPKEAKTNGKGEFRIKDLKEGDWTLEAKADKFAVRTMRVTVAAGAAPTDVKLINFENLQESIQKANQLFQSGDMPAARAEYEGMLKAQPDLTELHRMIAYTYGKEGNHAKALEHIDLLLEAERTGSTSGIMQTQASPAEAKNQLLVLALDSATRIGREDKIQAYLSELNDSALADPAELVNIAIYYINKEKYTEAVALLDRTQTAFPESPLHLFYRGILKLRQQQMPEAKGEFEKFVAQASSMPAYAGQVKQAEDYISKIK